MQAAIPFNKPYFSGQETTYIKDAVASGKISGDGIFTKKCHTYFVEKYNFNKVLLTTSCTDALELSAILLNIKEGDEVIMPSYTFVSTANAFVLRGALLRFADSSAESPNMDVALIEPLINERTKAIVVVHYAGIANDMDPILALCQKYNLVLVEDAAQAIDSYYKGRPLGSIGALSAFSFHETKNIIAGEGGMIAINDMQYAGRAEIIREKGTNRSAFFRGEVDKYGWCDVGSSFLPSDIIAAFLYAQLENLEAIQAQRKHIWQRYEDALKPLVEKGLIETPFVPSYATNNGHMFYIICKSLAERSALIDALKADNILAVFHYISLHKSTFFLSQHDGRALPQSDRYSDCLLRLPLYMDLSAEEQDRVIKVITAFYTANA